MTTFGKKLGIRQVHWAELVKDLLILEEARETHGITRSFSMAIDSILSEGIEMVHNLVIQEQWDNARKTYPKTMSDVDYLVEYWYRRFETPGEDIPVERIEDFLGISRKEFAAKPSKALKTSLPTKGILMEIILAVIVGYILASIKNESVKKKASEFYSYLSSPVTRQLELNWSGRQLFRIISISASERWYESRAHLNQGVFVSFLCVLNIVYVFEIRYGTEQMDTEVFKRFVWLKRSRDYGTLIEKAKNYPMPEKAVCLEAIFIAGHNVAWSCYA